MTANSWGQEIRVASYITCDMWTNVTSVSFHVLLFTIFRLLIIELLNMQSMAKAFKFFIMKKGKSMSLTMIIFLMNLTHRMVANVLPPY